MDQWWQVILEWVNCLGIIDGSAKTKFDFQDGYIYRKIIEMIGVWKADISINEENDQIVNFIKDEYPDFLTDVLDDNHDIYLASLFLLRASQEPDFQKPMCSKLHQETQIKIKMFLETLIPYGRHVTGDVIDMAINELIDDSPCAPSQTPLKRPLREFFTSPAAVSAQKQRIVNERDRQIRHLRSELETVRCEKAYLQDDLKSREDKINKLQAKLQSKNDELKTLRDERITSYTPQSCKKSIHSMEMVYKKEIENLEEYISRLQRDLEKAESDKDQLSQDANVLRVKLERCEDKSGHFEKQSELLLAQLELKDREIVDLRIQNEEFRTLLRETKNSSEQSFECDDSVYNKGRRSLNLNTSEVMSSVVEVQLLEVQRELDSLRAQLENATRDLGNATTENRGLRFTNDILKEKVEELDQLVDQVKRAEEEAKVKSEEAARMERELTVVSVELNHVREQMRDREEGLLQAEKTEKGLKNEIGKLTAKLQILEESMKSEGERCGRMKGMVSELEQERVILTERLKVAEESLAGREASLRSLEESEKGLRNDLNKSVAKIRVLEESLRREEAKLDETTGCLSSAERDNLVLIEKSRVLEKQVAQGEEGLRKAEGQVLHLTQELQGLKEMLEEEQGSCRELRDGMSKLEGEKGSLLNEVKSLNSKLECQGDELKGKLAYIEGLESRVEDFEKIVRTLETSLKEVQNKTFSLDSMISELEQNKENLTSSLENKKRELSEERLQLEKSSKLVCELQNQVQETQTCLESTKEAFDSEKLLTEDLRSKIGVLENDKSKLLEDLETAEGNCNTLNDLLAQAKANVEQRNKDNSNLENSLKKMEEFLAGERSEKAYLQTIIEKLESRERGLSENLNVVKAELNDKLQSLLTAMEEITGLKTSINALESSQQSLEENLKVEKCTVHELRNAVSQNEKENKRLTEENMSLKEDISKYEKSIAMLREEIEGSRKEADNVSGMLETERSITKDLQNSNQELENKKRGYEAIVKQYEEDTEKLQNEVTRLSQDVMEATAELKSKNNDLSELNDIKSKLESCLREKEECIEKLNENVSTLESMVDNGIAYLKEILQRSLRLSDGNYNSTDNVSLKKLCDELSNSLNQLENFIDLKTRTIRMKEEQLEESTSTLTKLQNDNFVLEEKVENLNTTIIDMSKEIAMKEVLLLDSQERETGLQTDLENAKASLSGKIQSLEEQLSKTEADLSRKIEVLENERLELLEKLSIVNLQNTEWEKEKLQLNNQLSQCSEKLLEVRTEKSELEKEKLRLEEESSHISKELSETQSINSSLEGQITRLEALKMEHETQILNTKTELEQLENAKRVMEEQNCVRISEIQEKVGSLESENAKLTSNVTDLTEECFTLKNQLREYTGKSKSLSNQTKHLESKMSDLNSQLEQKEQLIKKLSEEESRLRSLNSSLENQLSESQMTCEQLTANLKLKENSLDTLQQNIESLGKDKLESEIKLKEVIEKLQQVRVQQDLVLETQDKTLQEKLSTIQQLELDCESFSKSLKEKCSSFQQLENEYETTSNSLKLEKEKVLRLEDQCLDLEEGLKVEKNSRNELKKTLSLCQEDLKISKDLYNESRLKFSELYAEIKALIPDFDQEENLPLLDKMQSTITTLVQHRQKFHKLENDYQELESLSSNKDKQYQELQKELETLRTKRTKYESVVVNTLKTTALFQMLLDLAMKLRQEFDLQMKNLRDSWSATGAKYENVLSTSRQSCDSLRQLVQQREDLDRQIGQLRQTHFENADFLLQAMHESITSTEKTLKEGFSYSEEDHFRNLQDGTFTNDETTVNADIERSRLELENMQRVKSKVESFVKSVEEYREALKSGEVKLEPVLEDKLKVEVEKLGKEKKELKEKLDVMRTRNAKLEKNIDGLRNEIRGLKEGQSSKVESSELVGLNERIRSLEKEKDGLEKEKGELEKEKKGLEKEKEGWEKERESLKRTKLALEEEKSTLDKAREEIEKEKSKLALRHGEELMKKNVAFDERLKEVHSEYGAKLEVLKQKMKTAFSEQVTKLKQEQEKAVEEKVQSLRTKLEQQCRKHTDEISKYKKHVSDLSTKYWDVGEKLIFEKEEKEQALQQLKSLKEKVADKSDGQMCVMQKTMSLDMRDFPHDRDSFRFLKSGHSFQMVEEETVTRRHSVRSIQAMGNPFHAEDEEGEIFDNNYLADMKDGKQRLPAPDLDRLSVLQRRNTMCKPHLKSSYPAETQFQPPVGFSEEEIKTGGASDEIFNDSLSQSLLPGQKLRRKDRTQPSYKRPGPPTPSKNGGRLSLQGNELPKSPSKVLKEKNVERRTTVTPRRLKDLFGTSKRQDENGTPRSRRLSIFRKQRPADKA